MDINVSYEDNVAIVTLIGRNVGADALELKEVLTHQVTALGITKFILDLSQVTTSDNSGNAVIVGFFSTVHPMNGEIAIILHKNLDPLNYAVKNIMRLCETLDKAKEYFTQKGDAQ